MNCPEEFWTSWSSTPTVGGHVRSEAILLSDEIRENSAVRYALMHSCEPESSSRARRYIVDLSWNASLICDSGRLQTRKRNGTFSPLIASSKRKRERCCILSSTHSSTSSIITIRLVDIGGLPSAVP